MSYTYLDDCENSTSLPGLEGVSSAASFADIPQSVLLRLSLTVGRSCCNASEMESCLDSQSGMTLPPSTANHGEGLLMSCAEDSPAKTSQAQAKEQGSPEPGVDSGQQWPGSLAKWDRNSYSWKTHQFSLLGDLELFSGTWPKWGMMRDGECWELLTPVRHTRGTGSGSWPTPTRNDAVGAGYQRANGNYYFTLPGAVGATKHLPPAMEEKRMRMYPTPGANEDSYRLNGNLQQSNSLGAIARREALAESPESGGQLNPQFVEWLMGWPLGWTSLDELPQKWFNDWHAKQQRKKTSAEEIQSGEMHDLWFGSEPESPSSGWELYKQPSGQHPNPLPVVPLQGPSDDRKLGKGPGEEVDLQNMPDGISTSTEPQGDNMQEQGMQERAWPNLSRVAVGVKNRVDRLKAIGNGQVPAVAHLAWETLKSK